MGADGGRVSVKLCVAVSVMWLSPVMLSAQPASDEFSQWQAQFQQEFVDYAAKEQQDYAAFKKDVEKKWQQFVGSTKKDWVTYSDDKSSRSIVDFEKGTVTVEVIVPESEISAKSEAAKEAALKQAAKEQIRQRLLAMLADTSVQGESPIANQLQASNGKSLTKKDVDQFVKKDVDKTLQVESKPYVAKDGQKRVKASVQVSMVPDHLKIRADKYKTTVDQYAKKYNIEPSLVYAVIHTESYFNPKARSHIPAYGLMQLVPSSGGLDAYRFVKGKDKKPSPEYLYEPKNNIELGVGYLALLASREFKRVENDTVKKYLIVSAYNTGAGNVSKAFTGEKKLKAAVAKVNRMSPDAVYAKLVRDLPYEETRNYIQKVVDREKIYLNL